MQMIHHRTELSESFERVLREQLDENIFNPSIRVIGGRHHYVYRAFGTGRSKPFRAIHLERRPPDVALVRQDLTTHASGYGVDIVADPKLVPLGDDLYVTFNTGYSKTRNDVYLMQIAPTLGPPQRCVLDDRQPVEKNWGFFLTDGELRVLYSLTPPTLLVLQDGHPGEGELHFRRVGGGCGSERQMNLTIGTQPVAWRDGLVLIAHQKVRLRGRRGYFGRPVTIVNARDHRVSIAVSSRRLFHSTRGILHLHPQHNPNLLFATYFSGLSLFENTALLSYGINDLHLGVSEVPTELLWR